MENSGLILAATVAGLLVPPRAATTLPAADYSVQLSVSPPGITRNNFDKISSFIPGTYSLGGIDSLSGGILTGASIDPGFAESVIVSGNPTLVSTPSLAAATDLQQIDVGGASASVSIDYYFSVIGPPNTVVPLMIFVDGAITNNGIGNESAPGASFFLEGSNSISLQTAGSGLDLGSEDLRIVSEGGPAEVLLTSSYPVDGVVHPSVMSNLLNRISGIIRLTYQIYRWYR